MDASKCLTLCLGQKRTLSSAINILVVVGGWGETRDLHFPEQFLNILCWMILCFLGPSRAL